MMGNISVGFELNKNEVLVQLVIDIRVLKEGEFKGKLEFIHIMDHEFINKDLFFGFYEYGYIHEVNLNIGGIRMDMLDDFHPLQVLSLMNLL